MDSEMILARGGEFSSALLLWFARAARDLPWRRDCSPYRVWISEIMLQQTQMERGVEYFKRWMRLFPDVESVARADESAVLAAWEGLGYYSRARNLHRAAKTVVREYGGDFPSGYADIRALPGVGEYTAGAISSIAFDNPRPAVDANVLRIFSRLCDIDADAASPETRRGVTELVRALTPEGRAGEFCQALMELGALVCGKRARCAECPVAALCLARERGTVPDRPVRKASAGYRKLVTVAAVVARGDEVFIRQRPEGGLWPGLWEFPGGVVGDGEDPERALDRALGGDGSGIASAGAEKIGLVRHGYTVWRVALHGYLLRAGASFSPPGGGEWAARGTLGKRAFPAGQRKLLELLGWKS